MTSAREFHASRTAHFERLAAHQQRKFLQFGNARLATFAVAILVAILAWGFDLVSGYLLLAPAVALVAFTALLDRAERGVKEAQRGLAHYANAKARLDGSWPGTGNVTTKFADPNHLYAADLDLFGRGSLFEYLCVARTAAGERNLASWLLVPAPLNVATERQLAVKELAAHVELREALALMGDEARAAANDDQVLRGWGEAAPVPFPTGTLWMARLLGALASAALILWLGHVLPLYPLLFVAALEMLFGGAIRKPVEAVCEPAGRSSRELALVGALLARVEAERFDSTLLTRLRATLVEGGVPASEAIRRLTKIEERLEWLRNSFFQILATLIQWQPQVALSLEAWRLKHGPKIGSWMTALGEIEALCSLANFAFERPTAQFPDLVDGGLTFDAKGLAHPLIAESEAVPNDVRLDGDERLWIISGSNMSGKSTLLRAVGLASALAWAGAPVTAERLRISRLRVGASLRTTDSLTDHRSRFYAEILRLRAIVDLARSGEPTLFLLDELLSGTNSQDRRVGAEAVVRGLLDAGAMGMATTHDLALADIVPALGGEARGAARVGAKNVHLEDRMEGSEIRFDYRLRPGVVERGNALALMRAIGLDV